MSFGDRNRRITGTLPAFFSILLTLLVVSLAPFATGPPKAPPPPPEPKPQVVTIETRIDGQGYDRHHRVLPFSVYVLSQELSWRLQSVTDLEGGQTMLSPELVEAVNRARDIFCIGTASFEGATLTEEERAAQRAGQLVRWIAGVVRDPQQTRVIALNAGQYRGPAELASASQRKAVLIATGDYDHAVNLEEGLSSGLRSQERQSPLIASLLHDYSRSNRWLKMSRAGHSP